MAYSWIRSGDVRPAQYEQAMVWAKKATDYVSSLTETAVRVLQPITGNRTRIFWVARHETLAALEQWINTIDADDNYKQLVTEANTASYFTKVEDTILKILD